MPIDQGTFFNKSQGFIELANELDITVLEELRRIANRLVNDPDLDFEDRIRETAETEAEKWSEESKQWIRVNLAQAYLLGVNMQDRELDDMVDSPKMDDNPIPMARFSEHARLSGSPSEQAKQIIEYVKHWDSYARYEATFEESVNKVRLPFRRSTVQNYRDLASRTMMDKFRQGSSATRRDLMQDVLNGFADRGINVVQFPSRHKMSIEAFAHREARAYLQHTALQGQMNRAIERGYQLVRINAYAGPSPMCAPYQGKVFSLTGDSDKYPPLQDAIHDGSYYYGSGLFHDFCGHFQSTYIPGVSPPQTVTSDEAEQKVLEDMGEREGNRFIYQQRQTQRDIEYNIRKYKRRKAAAMDKAERDRNDLLIRRWQAKQREHVSQHDFLKRNYTRENF